MPRDASITDFADEEGSSAGDEDGGGEDPVATGSDVTVDPPDADPGVEPPAMELSTVSTTVEWDGAEQPCDACGESVHWRWQDGDDRVCGDCMIW